MKVRGTKRYINSRVGGVMPSDVCWAAVIEYAKNERVDNIVDNVSTVRYGVGAPGRVEGVKIATEYRVAGDQTKYRLPNVKRNVGTTRDVAGPYP